MLGYAITFLVVAILAAIFGFGLAATAFAALARIVFYLLIIGFVVTLVLYFKRRRV